MSGRTYYQKLEETRGFSNPLAAIFKGSEAVLSFFETNELPVESHRPVNPRDIHFNNYRVDWKKGLVLTKMAPTFVKREIMELVDEMDPLAILLLKEEKRLMGYPIDWDVEDDDELTLSEWLAMTRSSDDDIELHFTNTEEEHLAQLSDATSGHKSEALRKPRNAFFTKRRR